MKRSGPDQNLILRVKDYFLRPVPRTDGIWIAIDPVILRNLNAQTGLFVWQWPPLDICARSFGLLSKSSPFDPGPKSSAGEA